MVAQTLNIVPGIFCPIRPGPQEFFDLVGPAGAEWRMFQILVPLCLSSDFRAPKTQLKASWPYLWPTNYNFSKLLKIFHTALVYGIKIIQKTSNFQEYSHFV